MPRQPDRSSPRPPRRAGGARLLGAAAWAALAVPATAQEWEALAYPTTRDLAKLSFLDPLHGWAAGDSGTILVTTDGGVLWSPQTSPVDFPIVDLQMVDTQRGWALAQELPAPPLWEYGSTLLRTTDGGASWFVQSTFDDLFVHALAFTGATNGCIGGEQGYLAWTSDGGATWTDAVVDSAASAHWPVQEIEFHTPTYGLATGGQYDVTGNVWRTTDGGHTWAHQRVAGEPFFGIHFLDSLEVVVVGGDLDYGAGMVQTSTGGASWTYTYLGIWGRASAVSFRTQTEGWAPLGFAGTLMKTRDAGDRWTEHPSPDDTPMHDVVFTSPVTGLMAGNGGTILHWVGDVTSADPAPPAAAVGGLRLVAAPNPFAARTRVEFRVPAAGRVSLTLYDVLGREVARVVDDEPLPGGTHSRDLDAAALPAGVYFGKLRAGDASATGKLSIIR